VDGQTWATCHSHHLEFTLEYAVSSAISQQQSPAKRAGGSRVGAGTPLIPYAGSPDRNNLVDFKSIEDAARSSRFKFYSVNICGRRYFLDDVPHSVIDKYLRYTLVDQYFHCSQAIGEIAKPKSSQGVS